MTIQERLDWFTNRSKVGFGVFDVTLKASDHSSLYTAQVTLRGSGRRIATTGKTPTEALDNLQDILRRMICPQCGTHLTEPYEEDAS